MNPPFGTPDTSGYSHAALAPLDSHNQALAANVHPTGWQNPTPSPFYDLVVIGAGTAGLICAAGAAGLGARTALIEKDLMGGDCLNVGCVPSKALLRASRAAADTRDLQDFGIRLSGDIQIDFAITMERLRKLRAGISEHDSAARFKGLGVDVFLGAGTFASARSITVAGQSLKFRHAVIATGARAAIPNVPGLSDIRYYTNETIFTLTSLPKRLAIIGGGPIGCELAQAFARLGSAVTILTKGGAIIPREDPDAAALISAALQRDGVEIVAGARITSASQNELHTTLAVKTQGTTREVMADAVLVATGRAPNVQSLNLAGAGVKFDARSGVAVDDYLRTTNPRIYAAGDVCSNLKFTHAADAMARIVIQNALFFGRKKASDLVIPWCTYTDPEVAHVGIDAAAAATLGAAFDTVKILLGDIDRAVLNSQTDGFLKLHVMKKTGQIAGATLVAPHAGEMISEITLAMTAGISLGKIGSVIHPYPTESEIIKRAADTYNRRRLTPQTRRLLSGIIKVGRVLKPA